MKLIIAIIQPDQLPAVKRALYEAQIYHITCTNILGTVANYGERQTFRGVEHEVTLFQKVRLEFPVNDSFVETAINAIVKGGQASGGAGKIFVTELCETVTVRTGERGPRTIQEETPVTPETQKRREQPALEPRPREAVTRPAAFLKAVTGGRTPPTPAASRTPPSPAPGASAGVEARPPRERREGGALKEKPFKLIVQEADKKAIKAVWARLCYDYPQHTPPEFNDIYPYLSTVHEGTFAFRKGDPQQFKQKIEQLLSLYGLEHANVVIES